MTNYVVVSFGGIGAVLLSGIFAALKVFKVDPFTNWDWVWVFAPLWIGFAIFVGFIVSVLVFGFIFLMISDALEDRKFKKLDAKYSAGPTAKPRKPR